MDVRVPVLLLICLCVGVRFSDGADSTVFALYYTELRICLQDQYVPPVKEGTEVHVMRAMLATSQDTKDFIKVQRCVSQRILHYNGSTVAQRFLQEMVSQSLFQPGGRGLQLAVPAYTLFHGGPLSRFDCPTLPVAVESCSSNPRVERAMNASMEERCSTMKYNTMDCIDMSMQLANCSNDAIAMTKIFAGVIFSNCDMYTTSAPDIMTTHYFPDDFEGEGDFYNSPINRCLRNLVNSSDSNQGPLRLETIFPPSEFNLDFINNASSRNEYRDQLRQNLNLFCSQVSHYSECVLSGIASSYGQLEQRFGLLLDTVNFTKALEMYCAHRELVPDQLDCMVHAVSKETCHGGVLDVLSSIADMEWYAVFGFSCSDIHKQTKCRLEKQLKMCNPTFADVMAGVTNMMLTQQCRDGGVVSQVSATTAVPPCLGVYFNGIQIRSETYDLYDDYEEPSPPGFADMVYSEISIACGLFDKMLTCMDDSLKSSQLSIDKFIKNFISVPNLKKIFAFACSKKELFKKNGVCLVNGFDKLMEDSQGCFHKTSDDMRLIINDLEQSARGLPNTDSEVLKERMCKGTEQYGSCMHTVFAKCDKETADVWNQLKGYIINSCSNASYIVGRTDGQSGNGAGPRLLSVLSTVLPFFTLVLVYI